MRRLSTSTSFRVPDNFPPSRSAGFVKLRSPLLFAFLLASTDVVAQTGWEPLSGGSYFDHQPNVVQVLDSLHAVTAGEGGSIYRTTDGGTQWITLSSGVVASLHGIWFTDADHGIAVGDYGTILRTSDGGDNWRPAADTLFGTSTQFQCVTFSDPDHGIISAWPGKIWYTTDGGITWNEAGIFIAQGFPRKVRCSGSVGYAVGTNGSIYHTTDFGATWTAQATHITLQLYDVSIIDSLSALAVGDWGTILRTVDGGTHWTPVPGGTYEHFRSVCFYDSADGIIGGQAGSIRHTTDGGATWSVQPVGLPNSIDDISFASPAFGVCITGDDGKLYRSGDGGFTWDETVYAWSGRYLGICTVSQETVFVAGEGGRVLFSADSGLHWTRQSVQTTATLRGIQFVDPKTGWVVGDSGIILHTTDAGHSWTRQPSGSDEVLQAVSFTGPTIGTVVGENNTILRTTSSGETWTPLTSGTYDHWQAVSCNGPMDGVVAGIGGSLIQTSDGGSSWHLAAGAISFSGVDYVDDSTIVAVGRLTPYGDPGVLRSTDGGESWSEKPLGRLPLKSVSFTNPGVGYIAGENGTLYATQDSGNSVVNRSATAYTLNAVSMAGPRAAFAAGDSGIIQRMLTTGAITGTVFDDRNQDSLNSPGEPARPGWMVSLNGPVNDSVMSDAGGFYRFAALPYGTYSVRIEERQFFDQTTPPLFPLKPFGISFQHETESGHDIGISGPHVRIRIPIYVSDNTTFAHRYVWCGVRPGATSGIWGPDSNASITDSLEGEFEIPPRSFAEFVGLFDARFTDPHVPLNTYSDQFGEGSWTDSRDYRASIQSDTFLLSFLPGYFYGGGYPIFLQWAPGVVSQSFRGPVLLVDRYGTVTDMKHSGTVTVTDSAIESMLLVANSPNFPDAWLTRWRLLSLPAPAGDGRIVTIFPSASSRAWSFRPGAGYEPHDTLAPDIGYWLKYPPAVDTLAFDASARTHDTVRVYPGWNLVGTLSAPIGVNSLVTDPEDLGLGYFFGFENGYSVADTLFPGRGYWVRADGEGVIVMNANSPNRPGTVLSGPDMHRTLSEFYAVTFEDAESRSGTLYLSRAERPREGDFDLPPYPPPGAFDVRFGSQRFAEGGADGSPTEHPVYVSSVRFPLNITLARDAPVPAFIRLGEYFTSLRPGETLTIPDGNDLPVFDHGERYVLPFVCQGQTGTPSRYHLDQNYPNPFNPSTMISYALPVPSRVRITVFDLTGRVVAGLVDGVEDAGYTSITWDARDVSSGVYFCRMEAVDVSHPATVFSQVRKMVVMR